MTMNWDDVWERLSVVFQWLVEEVARTNTQTHSSSGRTATDTFPFGAYVSFSRSGEPGVEDLVVSIDCKREDDELTLSSDIARGDGYVLAVGPAARVRNVDSTDSNASTDVLTWVEEVSVFLRAHRTLICSELHRETESR